ncbi:MAG: hypothetical protein ACPGSI_13920 [Pikeienuella sp.]
MKIEFVGQSASNDTNIAANPSRLINLYREAINEGGRTRFVLRNWLGQDQKDDIGVNPVRAMGYGNSKEWLAGNSALYEIASDGALTSRGAIADDANTVIGGNLSNVTITAGNNYYIYNGAVSQPATKTFTNVNDHCHVGGYTVITEKDGQRFQWSTLGDAGALDALDFATANKVDDNIVRSMEFRGNLILFCEESTEIWSVVAGATGPEAFTFIDVFNRGLKSFNLVSKVDDAVFFVGNDGIAYIWAGGSPQPVSSSAVNSSIKNSTPTHCFFVEDEGHKFCVLRFSDRPAWAFDISMAEWNERAENAPNDPWRATHSVRNSTGWFVGNSDGAILQLARTAVDISAEMYRTIVGYTIYNGDRFTVPKVELLFRAGDHDLSAAQDFILTLGDGDFLDIDSGEGLLIDSVEAGERTGEITLYESRDGGRTYGEGKTRSLGVGGDYEQRAVWRARGQFRQYTPKWVITDPADITIYADGVVG